MCNDVKTLALNSIDRQKENVDKAINDSLTETVWRSHGWNPKHRVFIKHTTCDSQTTRG